MALCTGSSPALVLFTHPMMVCVPEKPRTEAAVHAAAKAAGAVLSELTVVAVGKNSKVPVQLFVRNPPIPWHRNDLDRFRKADTSSSTLQQAAAAADWSSLKKVGLCFVCAVS